MSYRLRSGEESARYRPGQIVSNEYAARYPHKVLDSERSAAARRGWETRRENERARALDAERRALAEEAEYEDYIELTVEYEG